MANRSDETDAPLSRPDPWTWVAEGYAETTLDYLKQFSDAGLARLDYDGTSRVIDIACGPGTTALALAPHVERIACVDFSSGMLDELRHRVGAAGATNLDLFEADGQALPFAEQSFDIGISMFGLMFFPDRSKGFRELHRVLRSGGQALVSSWAPVSRSELMQAVIGALRPDEAADEDEVPAVGLEDPAVFAETMRQAGFDGVEVFPVSRSLAVEDIETFWRDTVRGTAPVAMLKRGLDAAAWRGVEEKALRRLDTLIGPRPATLSSTAFLALARRP
ncbi:class I SAM-dependent methyltransferase [Mesorhizobium xinjiangense]|uniref:class I SAM-dependent methyltransferase n=1 Tax=Mesorhizobium xinjiangense TaxID=2678685 RepID=UPI0012ECCEA7|nr:methyltransferase domain-containing protein [Mesorhizobium xinjiangense]